MIEDLRFTSLGLWDETLVEHIEDILTDFLEFGFDLLTVVADGGDMLVRSLGLFFLLDGRNYAPRCTSCANDIFVGDR